MKKLSDRLRSLREDNDLTQADVAKLINKRQQQYSKYETGESEPSLSALSTLADYYGISIDYLMGRTSCREGIAAQNMEITPGTTVGMLISDVMALNESGRTAVNEYIELLGLKEKFKHQKG
ncbi:MAG: helix-turn-helix domain-containing protein [Defluviitaleaceae bacterium]|nr:helix-turn-helix domain-containing protein [Defluviitaleaceae bacterium]